MDPYGTEGSIASVLDKESPEEFSDPHCLTLKVAGDELEAFTSGNRTSWETLWDYYGKCYDEGPVPTSAVPCILERMGIDRVLVNFDVLGQTKRIEGFPHDFCVMLRFPRDSLGSAIQFTAVSWVIIGEYYEHLEAFGFIRYQDGVQDLINGYQRYLGFEKKEPYVDPRDPYIMAVAMAVMLVRRRLSETEAGR